MTTLTKIPDRFAEVRKQRGHIIGLALVGKLPHTTENGQRVIDLEHLQYLTGLSLNNVTQALNHANGGWYGRKGWAD